MCGIWTYFGAAHPDDRLVDISHRGPDDKGRKTMPCTCGVLDMAHWRLSVIDTSKAGAQPMPYMDGRYLIVFNGEIYNYRELRKELERGGYFFHSDCDTEIIMAAYDCWGGKCLERFLGMFAFALWDCREESLFLARDRFGIKPLYYFESERGVAFASEIKQFQGLKDFQAMENAQRVTEYLIYGAQDHTSETLFGGVKQLRGGECVTLSLRNWRPGKPIVIKTWYQLKAPPTFAGTYEEAVEKYRVLFDDVIRLHLRSDVPLGSCLSGGMDSSAIVCTMNQLLNQGIVGKPQSTFSCCFEEKECDESRFMEAVENATGAIEHHIFPTLGEMRQQIEKLVWHQDEPLGNASLIGQHLLFEAAKTNGITVMLDGQGGDEQLASYPQFFGLHLLDRFMHSSFRNFSAEARALKKHHQWKFRHSLHTLLFWFAPSWGIEPSAMRKRILGEPRWMKQEYIRGNNIRLSLPWKFRGAESPKLNVAWLSWLMLSKSTIPMLLHWEDRNSMANGIEARVPFLDHRLVEFTLSLPDEFKTYRGSTKRILKSAMKNVVPSPVLERMDKKGFVTPEERWFRNMDGESFRDEVLEAAALVPDIICEKGLRQEMDLVLSRKKAYTSLFWRIMSFGVWVRKFGVKI